MNQKLKAIFIDIDGCLISDSGNVCPDYYQALSEISQLVKKGFVGNGPTVRLCSGRNISSVQIMCAVLGIVNSFMIVENGVALFNPTTSELKLHPTITEQTRKLFRKILQKRIPPILKKYPNLSVCPGNIIDIALERKSDTKSDLENMYNEIRRILSDLIKKRIIKIFCSRHTINIGPAKIGKGSGVRFLADIDNINLSQSLAIGDTSQDIPLFKQVKLIGCPSNASDDCKKFVKSKRGRISIFSHAQGVIDIIKYYTQKS